MIREMPTPLTVAPDVNYNHSTDWSASSLEMNNSHVLRARFDTGSTLLTPSDALTSACLFDHAQLLTMHPS